MENKEPSHPAPRVAMAFCETRLTDSPIVIPGDPAPGTGARLDFLGIVRPSENSEPIAAIDYHFHPTMAEAELARIVAEAASTHPLLGCRLVHRVGVVPTHEPSLFVRVDTAHRDPAYTASRWIIEQLKLRAPIWKHPIFTNPQSAIRNPQFP